MKKIFIKLFLLIGMLFVGMNVAYAADSISFKIDGAKDYKPGDVFSVNVSVTGPTEVLTLTDYELTVSYDNNKLELVEGSATISASNQSVSNDATLSTLKFKANAAGNSKLELAGTGIKINGDKPENDVTINYNSGTVSIREIGKDSTLKSLKIPNTVLSPEFNKNIHDYKATVTDVTSIEVKAEPSESHATVWTNGVDGNLQKGENTVVIVCKAENGTESTYSIKVTLNVTPTEEELKARDTSLKALTIKGQKIEFNSNEKKYYINVDYDVTKININATPTNPNAEVTISGNSKFVVGKNTVKINVTSEDKTATDTYQIIVTRAEAEKEVVKTCPEETSKKEWVIFTSSLLLTFTLGIVLGYFLCRKEVFNKLFKKETKEEIPVEIATLSDTIDLSDTVKQTASKTSNSDEQIETIDTDK